MWIPRFGRMTGKPRETKMKKILFATTALVATAGVAAADVSFSGYGRFGAMENYAGVSGIYTRIRLQIDMSTEADNGLTFGARLRMQDTSFNGVGYGNGGAGTGGFNGARFYAKVGGLEIGVGNIIGAIEGMSGIYMATQSGDIGLSGLGFNSLVTNTYAQGYWTWDAYSSGGTGVDGVEVMYSAGDFSGHLSYSNGGGIATTGLNVAYSFNDWTVALGYQDGDTIAARDKAVITVGGKIGPVNLGLAYADNDGVGKVALTGQVEVGAATRIDMFVADEDTAGLDTMFGLGVSHSLGGGASLEGGVANDGLGNTAYDLGVKFNF